MTCIIYYRDSDGIIYLAADLQYSWSNNKIIGKKQCSKIHRLSFSNLDYPIFFGLSGHIINIDDLLRTNFKNFFESVDITKGREIYDFAGAMREFYASKNLIKKGNMMMSFNIILIYNNIVYLISGDFSVIIIHSNYQCSGSGEDFAMGYLKSQGKITKDVIIELYHHLSEYDPYISSKHEIYKITDDQMYLVN